MEPAVVVQIDEHWLCPDHPEGGKARFFFQDLPTLHLVMISGNECQFTGLRAPVSVAGGAHPWEQAAVDRIGRA